MLVLSVTWTQSRFDGSIINDIRGLSSRKYYQIFVKHKWILKENYPDDFRYNIFLRICVHRNSFSSFFRDCFRLTEYSESGYT